MSTNISLDVEKPNGYGIVNPETGKVRLIWKILSIVAFCLIVRLMLDKGNSISADRVVFWLILWVASIVFMLCAKKVVGGRIHRYRKELDVRSSIHLRISARMSSASKEAKESILQNKELERARKMRQKIESYELLVETNMAFPECQERLSCRCRKGEGVLYFVSSALFCEQRSRDGLKRWEKSDVGCLQITNKRIIFVGSNQNREYGLNDIVAVDASEDAVILSVSNRVKPIGLESLDGWLVATIIKLSKANPEWKVMPRGAMIEPPMESLDCDVNSETLCAMNQTAIAFVKAIKYISEHATIDQALQQYSTTKDIDDCSWFTFKNYKLGFVAVADLFVSFLKLGHSVEDLSSPEGLGLLIALSKLFACDREINISEWREKSFRQGMEALLSPYIAKINDVFPFYRQDNALYATDIVSKYGYSVVNGYVLALYKWAIQIVGADNEVSTSEKRWLGVLKCYSTLKGRIGDKATMISLQEINSIKCD